MVRVECFSIKPQCTSWATMVMCIQKRFDLRINLSPTEFLLCGKVEHKMFAVFLILKVVTKFLSQDQYLNKLKRMTQFKNGSIIWNSF